MKKHLAALLSLFCAIMMLCTIPAVASDVWPDDDCTLTLQYVDEVVGPIEGVEFSLYTIAKGHSGRYEMMEPFSAFYDGVKEVDWEIGESMLAFSKTLSDHITAEKVKPDTVLATDSKGSLTFTDLEMGLYLVLGNVLLEDSWVYTPQPILIWLPCADPNGGMDYNPVCDLKHDRDPEKIDRQVEKVWVDDGTHPQSVVIQLICDGEVYDEVVLNDLNNWKYVWNDLPGTHDWEIQEKDVPEGYTATVTQDGDKVTVTNTKDEPKVPNTTTPPDDADNPKTGDQSLTMVWVALLLISGTAIVMAVINGKRKHN